MSADVLVLTVTIDGAYASANAVSDHGATRGKKSPAYLELFRSVREAARAAMAATGWETAHDPCEVQVVRYHATRRLADAPNLGKVECDALEPSTPHEEERDKCDPFPGVFANDDLVRPYSADVEYDPAGPDRVVVIIRRRFPDVLVADAPAPRRSRRPAPTPAATEPPSASKTRFETHFPETAQIVAQRDAIERWRPGDPIPDGYADLGGKLVPRDEALRLITGRDRDQDRAPRARRGAR